MPVIDEKTKRLMKAVQDKKHYERIADRLAKANDSLMGEIAELKKRIAELEEACSRKGKVAFYNLCVSLKRAKQLEAIKRIIDGEFALDTSGESPETVRADKKPVMWNSYRRNRIDHI